MTSPTSRTMTSCNPLFYKIMNYSQRNYFCSIHPRSQEQVLRIIHICTVCRYEAQTLSSSLRKNNTEEKRRPKDCLLQMSRWSVRLFCLHYPNSSPVKELCRDETANAQEESRGRRRKRLIRTSYAENCSLKMVIVMRKIIKSKKDEMKGKNLAKKQF